MKQRFLVVYEYGLEETMSMQSFEVTDIKCIDDSSGDQGLIFIGPNKLVTIVLERGRKDHDKEICSLQRTLWNTGHCPFTMFIQDL
jgi:hypothetical protein